jgi:hypothetical protein
MIRTLDRPSACHGQGNEEAGQKRPGVFAFYDPGPQLQNFTKKICFKSKTLCYKPTTRLTRREFCKSRFLRSQPVASALDLRTGATPIRRPSLYHVRSAARMPTEQDGLFAARNFFFVAGTDLPNSSCAGKTVKQH